MLYLFSILYVKILHSVTLTPLSIQALLVSLDLGAAFDTITHIILLYRLSASFGVSAWHCLAMAFLMYNRAVADCTSWKFYIINSKLFFWCSSRVSAGPHSSLNKRFSCLPHCTFNYYISHQQYAIDILLYIALCASQPHSGIHIIYLLNYQPKAVQEKWNAKISWSW